MTGLDMEQELDPKPFIGGLDLIKSEPNLIQPDSTLGTLHFINSIFLVMP